MAVGIGSVEPTNWSISFSRYVWFPPTGVELVTAITRIACVSRVDLLASDNEASFCSLQPF